MANRGRMPCFVCNTGLIPRVMARIDRQEDILKREVSITRRDTNNRPPLEITDRTRRCNNCNISITREIELTQQDPFCLRLNVLTQTSSQSCFICNNENNLNRLSIVCRVNIYLKREIFVSENTKCCPEHLNEQGNLIEPLIATLNFFNRPYSLKGVQLKHFLNELPTWQIMSQLLDLTTKTILLMMNSHQ